MAVRLGPLTVKGTVLDEDNASSTGRAPAWTPGTSTGRSARAGRFRWPMTWAWRLPRTGGFLTLTVGTPEVDILGDGVLQPTELGWMIE